MTDRLHFSADFRTMRRLPAGRAGVLYLFRV